MRGSAIRARREQLGRTLAEVARATRIPEAHLAAIEAGRLDDLPAGPYAAAYIRAVCAELGLDDSDDELVPMPVPPQGAPLWLVRALAGLSVLALIGLLASLAWERLAPGMPPLPVSRAPDQQLVIVAQRATRLAVVVDGEVVLDRPVPRGERLEYRAADRIELSLPATSHVRLEWNGVTVVPQGRQDVPRTLVFVDDRGLGW